MRTLQANGQYHLTKLGKAFFKDKYTEWLAHVFVIIPGPPPQREPVRKTRLPPGDSLELGLSRQNDAWSEAQVARNVKEAVLRQLGQPEANDLHDLRRDLLPSPHQRLGLQLLLHAGHRQSS